MGVSTVETNRDRDRDCPLWRDQFLKPVEIFKIETFQSRLCRVKIFVEIVETHWDCRDLSRFVKICRDAVEICRDAVEICQEISTRKYKNPCTSQSRSRQTVEKHRNFQISTKFSISIEIFWSGRWCRDEIEIVETYFLTLSRFSQLSRLTLWRRRDRESRSRPRRDKSRPPGLEKPKNN